MYKDWLTDIFQLKAFTGARNEELTQMTWGMVYYENSVPIYMKFPNLKSNRLKNITKIEDGEFTYIPIGVELKQLLLRLKPRGESVPLQYIVSPKYIHRNQMHKMMGKCFAFYWYSFPRQEIIR